MSEAWSEKIIVALDVPEASAARSLVQKLKGAASYYKVGAELFTAAGPDLVRELAGEGNQVFLDLKYHDIPNTVGRAVARAVNLGASLLTVHASGGREMIRAAKEALEKAEPGAESTAGPGPASTTKLIAVTVLTSLSALDLARMQTGHMELGRLARSLAREALDGGADGLVCSPRELTDLRSFTGKETILVAPGIRPSAKAEGEGGRGQGASRAGIEGAGDDQRRVASAREAFADGADFVVVGRPVTAAADPRAAFESLLEDVASAGMARG